MTLLNDRSHASENKFEYDQDIKFKISVRRDKLMGLWLAEKMGLEGEKAETYAFSLVKSDLKEPGDDDILTQIYADCEKEGLPLTKEEILKAFASFFDQASQEIKG